MDSTQATLLSLSKAREIVLQDASHYPQIVPGVLHVFPPSAALELRRWGADFLAETFASPVIRPEVKQEMCPAVLDTLDRKSNV